MVTEILVPSFFLNRCAQESLPKLNVVPVLSKWKEEISEEIKLQTMVACVNK